MTINIHLACSADCSITNVRFNGDVHNQLSWVSNPNAHSVAVIQDLNDAVQSAKYKITVMDKGANVTLPCDPAIANR